MTTVEAMSYGAAPIVYRDGGQIEVVTPTVGRTWVMLQELVDATEELAADEGRRQVLAHCAAMAAREYDATNFRRRVLHLVSELRTSS